MQNEYSAVIEALIFSSDEPLSANQIISAIFELDGEENKFTPSQVDKIVTEINQNLEEGIHGFRILRIAGGYIFATKPEYSKYIGYLSTAKSKRRLSQAALETLAIIAYKQPITKPEIESIRGVNSDYMINTLLEKGLITIKGRADTVGRPLLYATTDEFLKYFGINKISDLPKPREIEEIIQDEDFIEEKKKIMMNEIEEIIENEVEASDGTSE